MWKVVNQIYKNIKEKWIIPRGLQLSTFSRVTELTEKIDDTYGDKYTIIDATVIGDTANYDTEICLDKNSDVDDYYCSCPYYKEHERPCKHLVALANVYAQYKSTNSNILLFNSEKNKEAKTSNAEYSYNSTNIPNILYAPNTSITPSAPPKARIAKSEMFLDYNKFTQGIMANYGAKNVQIIPVLHTFGERVFIRFKIGIERQYMVKDIAEFVDLFDRRETLVYSDKFIFEHNEESLLPNSSKYLQDMRAATQLINEERSQNQRYNSYGYTSITKVEKLPFSGEIADDVFDFSKAKIIELKNNKVGIIPKDTLDKILISVQKTPENNYVLDLPKEIFTVKGSKNCYILNDGFMCKCDEMAYYAIAPIAKQACLNKKVLMSEQHLAEWITNIAPLLQPYFNIVYEDIDTAKYEPLPLVAELYLDIDDNRINGNLKCFYGENQVDIYNDAYMKSGAGVRISESKLKAALEKYFIFTGRSHIIVDEDTQYEFISGGIAEIEKFCDIFASDAFNSFSVKKKPTVNVGIKLDGELLDIDVSFDDEYTADEIIKILQAYKRKKKYVKISANKFVELNGADYDVLDDLSEISGKDINDIFGGSITANKYRALHLDNLVKNSDTNYTRNTSFKELVKSVKSFEDADFVIDPSLDKKLRHYQKVGFRWFKALSYYGFGGILADDMGLGKSVQTIAFLQSLAGVSIVVCPSSLILNWKNEFEKFAPSMKALCVYGAKSERVSMINVINDYNVVITSYEILKKDIENYSKIKFEAAILDEGQYIKNHITLNAKAVKSIRSKYRFALTGTPIENNIAELWSIFDFIMPGYLYNYNKFKTTFENKIVKEQDATATNRLQQMVAPFVLRRLKKDVLKELPPKIDNLVSVPLEDEQRALYAANLAVIKGEIQGLEDYNKDKFMVLSYLLKLRQICCSPSLVADNYAGNSAKMDACMDLISTSVANGHKILVFSQFTSLLAIIKQKLIDLKISHYLLQGDTKKEERMDMVNAFNTNKTSVFLLSLKAGGTGLNLTAADVVIHYDPWWNLSVQNQATDRAHRIGQNKSVQVYRLILKDTIEEKIVKLQARKQELFDSIIKEGEVDFTKMSKDQLLDLLQN